MSLVTEEVRPQREGMPREVVAWIQTLHLPRAVRFPKRDLSNGFLVALICSRYWSSISMHSYEDKMSVVEKRSNWELLKKQFALNNCPLSDRMIDGMVSAREDYADSFLRQLYTQLTGRMIVEAAPLPATEVSRPKAFLPPAAVPNVSTTKVNVEVSAAPANGRGATLTSRVRGLRSLNVSALSSPERIQPVPAAKSHVIHAIPEDEASNDIVGEELADDAESRGGNDGDDDKKKQKGKPLMDFSVSLRPAGVQQTVVHAVPGGSKHGASRSGDQRRQQQQQMDDHQMLTNDSTALDFIESIVRTQAADQGWPLSAGDDVSAPFTNYFLREESNLGALLPCRLWSALLGSVGELTDRVLRQGGYMADITALFLQRPTTEEKKNEPQELPQQRRSSLDLQHTTSALRLWKKKASPRSNSAPQRFLFISSLLSCISDVDSFLAVSIYCDDILPHCAEAMRSLDSVTADEYASLLSAVLPANRKFAARLLPDMLLAVQKAVTDVNTVVAKRSYYLFLRAIVLRIARPITRSMTRSPSSTTTTTSVLSTHDALTAVLFETIGSNVVAALSHESSTVRLVGVYLAEAIAFTGYPAVHLFANILPLMSVCIQTASPLFNCVCAAWLRTAMQRLSSLLDDCYDDDVPFENEDMHVDKRKLYTRAVPHLAAIMQHLSDTLQAPGQMNVKTYCAEQLAFCLDEIPSDNNMRPLFDPEGVARSVFSVLQSAPSELVAGFLTPPSSAERGSVRAKAGYNNGNMLWTHVECPLLGPLRVDGSLRECYPLALSEAVLLFFPSHSDSLEPSLHRERKSSVIDTIAGSREVSPATSRHILGKATLLLRNRVVPEDVAERVTWMYKIVVSCRNGSEFPERPASLSESNVTKRWNVVMRQMYRDIAVLAAAAEMLCAQKGALTDDSANAIARLAGMAQQIVLRWHAELKQESALLKSPIGSPSTSSEKMTGAMTWYHTAFSDMTSKEHSPTPQQQQQQQTHRQSRQSSAVVSHKSEKKR